MLKPIAEFSEAIRRFRSQAARLKIAWDDECSASGVIGEGLHDFVYQIGR